MGKEKPDIQSSQPAIDEFELSLFGPGKGESAVLHLGNGDWMIVDSCLGADRSRPAALEYLDRLGVVVGQQVKLIVVTHWHDDHIRGISQVMSAAASAKFACSAALLEKEFFKLLAARSEIKLVGHHAGLSEFSDTLEILDKRTNGITGPDYWAQEGGLLFQSNESPHVRVVALSPSAATITDSKVGFARLMPALGDVIRPLPRVAPNKLSVVLHVEGPGVSLLLGGDLECGTDVSRGWLGVVRSTVRPHSKSTGFKVPHHGSSNADQDEIWSELLLDDAYAMVTPYACGKTPIPTAQDIARLKERTPKVGTTVWPLTFPPPRRRIVDRAMGEVARVRRAIRRRPGHLRLRVPIAGTTSSARLQAFDGAYLH